MNKAACSVLVLFLGLAAPADATESRFDAATLCENAVVEGARASGVPAEVLHAITLAETGRSHHGRLRPWPWAVNRAGDGRWFSDRAEAKAFAEATLRAGRTNLDIGCFQMNYHWHNRRFEDLDQMFDPVQNAIQAGAFLKSLYEQTGDWSQAAGTYHSRTPAHARTYRARFDRILSDLQEQTPIRVRDIRTGAPIVKRSRVRLSRPPLIITIDPRPDPMPDSIPDAPDTPMRAASTERDP